MYPTFNETFTGSGWKAAKSSARTSKGAAGEIKSDLAEFIRKSDYRFRNEIMGKEGDSYKRAADMIHGKQMPTDRKDIR